MQLAQPKTIHLKDYKPSAFLIDSIHLTVDIFDERTDVKSVMHLQKSPGLKGKAANLELNGENVVLKSIKLNGQVLGSDKFQLSPEKLVLINVELENFTLEIENEINPVTNKSCEGFYQSGDQFCTQCEPEGFRKITYFIDRPDVMATFKTRMSGDKKRFPFLLSNGNKIGSGDLANGRHFMEWEDPFRKPSYLFAMVAGDFDVARDSFTTMKGRKVALEIFVDKGNLKKTPHAMASLKTCMKWDEVTYGLEYDLDIYMIVAVDSFNMGAMENKGLNIFNSTYTLADEKSATDHDFQNIEGVIGHEYFHNWTGNRVTCRDWFQLTLKEGLTVYRDQEFSSDVLSRAVKRLEDVRILKELQFAEDAGPMSHPIRPASYIEINNFYTRTVYEKGAEVIRMIETLIGKVNFRKGMDKYFELFDGKAVTTDDFVHAMEFASGKDLTQFRNWYSRPGTPTLKISSEFANGEVKLKVEQKYPPTTLHVPEGNVLHMPFKIAFLNAAGKLTEQSLELKQLSETFSFKVDSQPVISLNRNFTAPVNINYPHQFPELLHIMSFETDAYCKYEATQQVYDSILKNDFNFYTTSGKLNPELSSDFKAALENLLQDEKIDHSFKSYLLTLPTENTLCQEMNGPDFDAINLVRNNLKKKLGLTFQTWFLNQHERFSTPVPFELTPKAYGVRALKNQCLIYLAASETNQGLATLKNHYELATNMTEEIQALTEYVRLGVPLNHDAITGFYEKWKHDSLVMLKWFSTLASYSPKNEAMKRMEVLENDRLFQKDVPNYLRSLYLSFAKSNLPAFHAKDGSGYRFMADRIKHIDSFNPHVAARASSSFALINRLDAERREGMKQALNKIMEGKPSRDTFEVVSKYLAQ
ncbi:MAG: aminopeptidase N [Bdellovibrionales bacterium]|nr:aminopeptidase N [Bdellovibrionales bacterium]